MDEISETKAITGCRITSSILFFILTVIGWKMTSIETTEFKNVNGNNRGLIKFFLLLCVVASIGFLVIDSMILTEIVRREEEKFF